MLSSLRGGCNNQDQENITTEETNSGDGDGDGGVAPDGPSLDDKMFDLSSQEEKFPFKFASRLNSMKDRPDLWMGEPGVVGWIKRQGQIKGLDLIDFNYPQHITSPKVFPINSPCNKPCNTPCNKPCHPLSHPLTLILTHLPYSVTTPNSFFPFALKVTPNSFLPFALKVTPNSFLPSA